MLEGRTQELAALQDRLDALADEAGFALLVRGEAGIGKTTLLQAAIASAGERGLTVLTASGFEAESDLPYAALRRLVEPLLPLRERLPAGQAQALGASLGLEPPTPYERFAIPAALLALLDLAHADAGRPVLAVVDDVQWVDPASRETILFAARRLGRTAVGLLLGARDEGPEPLGAAGIEQLALTPLSRASAQAILERGPRPLAAAVVDQVADAAAGNPLALIEVAATLTPAQREGREPIDAPLRLGPLLEEAFARETGRLPEPARRAIGVAAAMENGTVGWLLDALDELQLGESALDAAERSGTLAVADGRVGFSHPLVRAAAYHAAGDEERRAAHQALAARAPDPARRAWHLAAASGTQDPAVADMLEEAALHARAVGGHVEAASAFKRAAELSTGEREQARRELEAAEELLIAGETERAEALVESAAPRAPHDAQARVARLRGQVAMRSGSPAAATRLLSAEAERRLDAADPEAAAAMLIEASVGAMMTGDLDSQAQLVGRALTVTGPEGGPLRLLAELFVAGWHVVRGRDAMGDAALAASEPRLGELDPLLAGEVVGMAALASLWIGDHARAERMMAPILRALREAGALGKLAYPVGVHAALAFRDGRWAEANAAAGEAVQLATETRTEAALVYALAVGGRISAARGEHDAARAAVARALSLCERSDHDGVALHAHGAAVFAELAGGAPEAAIAAADRVAEIMTRHGFRNHAATMAAGDRVEALLAAGRRDEAAAALSELAAWASESGSTWGAAATARGRVALSDADGFDALVAAARTAAQRLGDPFEQARTDLAIGERLRRLRRRADAREPLDRALTAFARLGAAPFAVRTRAALEATGTSRRSEPAGSLAALTPTERRIAELVREGRTNREIARELYVSEKTLERRLTALYRKLGIASRIDLARLAGSDPERLR